MNRAAAEGNKGPDSWPLWSILVVDDEPGMRNFLVKSLVPRCNSVFEAASAEDGDAIVRSTHVDLIILDIALPGRNGVGSAFQAFHDGRLLDSELDGALRTLVTDLVDAAQRTSDSDRPAA